MAGLYVDYVISCLYTKYEEIVLIAKGCTRKQNEREREIQREYFYYFNQTNESNANDAAQVEKSE